MKERILILGKTYPSPSANYIETSCIAGITEKKEMRRLFPIPFRLLDEDIRFSKWQWIEADTEVTPKDKRKESRHVDFNSIKPLEKIGIVKRKNRAPSWHRRMEWIEAIPKVQFFKPEPGNDVCTANKETFVLCRIPEDFQLIIERSAPEYTESQLKKLRSYEYENVLFKPEESGLPKNRLKKIPYDFFYKFKGRTPDGKEKELKYKINDWECGALYFNLVKAKGNGWEKAFREKIEESMRKCDLMVLLGNMHQYENEWIIVSLIYPLKQKQDMDGQGLLFDENF